MKLTAKILVPILAVSLCQIARAIAFTSVQTGDWSNPASWDDGTLVPDTYNAANADTATIAFGHVINYNNVGGGNGSMSTPVGLVPVVTGGFAIAGGNSVLIDGGTLTQTTLTQEMRVGEGTSGGANTGLLTIDTGGTLDTGASIGLGVGTKISGANGGHGELDLNDGLLKLGTGAAVGGLGVGIDASMGLLKVGNGAGAAGSAVVDLATNNVLLAVGANNGLGGGTGVVIIDLDGRINFSTGSINVGQGGGTGNLAVIAGGVITGTSGAFLIGQGTGSMGTLTNGGTVGTAVTSTGEVRIGGGGGNGTFNMTNGSLKTTGEFNIARDAGSVGTSTLSGGTLSVGAIRVGRDNGNGTLTISGATLAGSDFAQIGVDGGIGSLVISGGALNATNYLTVGRDGGVGTVNQTGGTVTFNQWAAIGVGGGANTSQWGISGGNLTSGAGLEVGADRGGTMNISGTANVTVGTVVLGTRTNGNGIVNKSGGTLVTTNLGIAGAQSGGAFGTFNLSGGTTTINGGGGQSYIGNRTGSVGTLNIQGAGTVLNNVSGQDYQIGFHGGTGNLNVTAGGVLNHNWWINVARNEGTGGTVGHITINGAGSAINQTAGQTNIGEDGTGTLDVTNGGAFNTVDEFSIGRNGGSDGTVNLSGAGSVINLQNHLFVGRNGTGTFNQSGGTVNLNGKRIQIGDSPGSTGLYNITAGAVNNSQWLHIASGAGSTGTLNVNFTNPANALTTGDLYLGNNDATANGFVNVNSGNLRMTGVAQIGRYGGTGTLTVTGPNSVVESFYGGGNDFFRVGMNGGHGIVNVSAGGKIKTNAGWFTLANDGAVGDATFTGTGTTLTSTGLIVGWSGLSTGTLTVADNAVVNNSGHEVSVGRDNNGVGNSPTGIINITSGGVINAGNDPRIGHNSIGVLNITNGSFISTGGSTNVADGGASNGKVFITNGVFTSAGETNIGRSGAAVGLVSMTGAASTFTSAGEVFVGRDGATGTLNLTGGTAQFNNNLGIGQGGGGSHGTVNITNATMNVNGWTTLGRDTGGSATVSTLNVGAGGVFNHTQHNGGDFLLGWQNGSTGAVNVTNGGTINYSWWTRVGVDPGSTGSILVDNGSTFHQTGGRTYIGEKATGSLTITNNSHYIADNSVSDGDVFKVGGGDDATHAGHGTLTIDATSTLSIWDRVSIGDGRNAGVAATGVVNVTGGSITAFTGGGGDFFRVGTRGGTGTMNVSAGGTVNTNAGWFTLGENNNSVGTATFNGTGTTLTSRGLIVGWNGTAATGTLNIQNNAVVNNSGHEVSIGRDWNGSLANSPTGTVTVSGGGVLNAGSNGGIRIGHGTTGSLTVTGANSRVTSSDFFVADGGNSFGTVLIENGGGVTATGGNFRVANSAGSTGMMTINGTGTVALQSVNETIIGNGVGANGTLNVNNPNTTITTGGEFQVGNDGGIGVANITAGTLNLLGYLAIGRNTNGDGGSHGGNGTLVLSGTGVLHKVNNNGSFDVGSWNGGNNNTTNTTGTLTQTGGSVVIDGNSGVYVGRDSGVVGNWNITGGTVSAAAGEFRIHKSGGAANDVMSVGGTGAFSLVAANDSWVGGGGTGAGSGTLNITNPNAAFTFNGSFSVGRDGATGTYNQQAGTMTMSNGEFKIGHNGGTGVVNLTGAGTKISHNGWIAAVGADGGGSTGTMNVSNGATFEHILNNNTFLVGWQGGNGHGYLNVTSGGTVNNHGEFRVAVDGGSNGDVVVDGATSSITNSNGVVRIGESNIGTMTIRNGATFTHTTGEDTSVGTNAGSQGTVNIQSGGVLNGNSLRIGHSGTGIVNVNAGTLNATGGWNIIGTDNGTSNGTVNLSAGSAFNITGGRVYIGRYGTGVVALSTGSTLTHTGADEFNVGGTENNDFASSGTLTVNATSSVSTTNFIRVGVGNAGANPAVGIVNLNGGTINAGNWMGFGHQGGDGTLNMNGGAITVSNEFYVGIDDNGRNRTTTGTANITGGTIMTTNAGGAGMFIGRNGGSGVVGITGTNPVALTSANEFNIGRGGVGAGGSAGTGTLNMSNANATVTVANDMYVGRETGTGTINLSGGVVSANNVRVAQDAGSTGTVNAVGGTIFANTINIATAGGTVNFAGGTFKAKSDTYNPFVNFTTGNSELNGVGVIVDTNGHALSWSNTFDGVGGLTKTGNGNLLVPTQAPAFTGNHAVNQGSLTINETSSLGSGNVVINGGRVVLAPMGLSEGRIAGNSFDTATANPGGAYRISQDRANSTDTAAFIDNSTWVYTGKFLVGGNSNVTWTFAEQFDDGVYLTVDGNAGIINDNNWNNPTKATVVLTPGVHTFEVRLGQGGGGVGPNSGWTVGFGYDPMGRDTLDPTFFQPFNDTTGVFQFHDFGGTTTLANNVTLNAASSEVNVPVAGMTSAITGLVSGGGGLTKTGNGVLTLNNANTYLGVTKIDSGTLRVPSIANNGVAQPLGQAASAILIGSASTGTLEYTGAPAANLQRDITVNGAGGGVLKNSSANTLTLSGTLTKNGNTLTLTGSGSFMVSGLIVGALPGSDLVVDGTSATLTNAANSYAGPTRLINAATLTATSNGVLGAAPAGVVISNASTLKAGGNLTIASRTITVGTGGGKIDTNGNTVTLGVGSTITGATGNALTHVGPGELDIKGTQTYDILNANGGVTTLDSALGTGTSTINANATVQINASQTLSALNFADGVEVTFGNGLPFAPEPPKPLASFGGHGSGLVPEPGSLGLLLVGALGLMARRRRSC